MHKKIALSIILTTLILSSTILLALPVTAVYEELTGSTDSERQIIVYGMLHDELFPEFNYTRWQKRSINVGFTAFGEMVTDQDPFGEGSEYGVGLQYPTDMAWQDHMVGDEWADEPDEADKWDYMAEEYGVYPAEHIAVPTGDDYYPIEGWQLYWKFKEGTPSFTVDEWWHLSMAVYGNRSDPDGANGRLDVVSVSDTVITDTSRLFIAEVKFRTHNQTLEDSFGFDPELFEITVHYVFFKNKKKVASYWTIEYLRDEYGPVEAVFRRVVDLDIDQKFQEGEEECFAQFFPTSGRGTARIPGETDFNLAGDEMTWANPADKLEGLDPSDPTAGTGHNHMFWTGCEAWPQNYSLAVVWTNSSITHWAPPTGYSVAPQHHVAFVAYYPNLSNWDTDNWNHYTDNLLRHLGPGRLFYGEGLGRRFSGQPVTVEFEDIASDGALHYAAANLLVGQWNFTISSTTAYKKAKFLTIYGITNCSDTFGYVGNCSTYDWDSRTDYGAQVTVSELKYLLGEFFNATYKLSTETKGGPSDEFLDMTEWYPFSGIAYRGFTERDGNLWIDKEPDMQDSRNTTIIIGDSMVHYDTVVAGGAATIDVVGAVMIGEAFGDFTDADNCGTWAPVYVAMYDTEAFSGLATSPYWTLEKDSDVHEGCGTLVDTVTLKLTGWIRRYHRMCNEHIGETSPVDLDFFTMPDGCSWDINHTITVGGPKVNLATAYANEHNWQVWVDPDTTGSELDEAGIFSIATGQFYSETGPYSVIQITFDNNLTSWTTIPDGAEIWDTVECTVVETNHTATDGPTLVDPYAILSVWGISGIDTHAAAGYFAHYWCKFHDLYVNATAEKRGAVCIVLNTDKMADVCDETWMYAIQEISAPVAGRYRSETGDTWGPWYAYPCSIDWASPDV